MSKPILVLLLGVLLFAVPAAAGTAPDSNRLTKAEALALAFPECEVERTTFYLKKEEKKQADELAGFDVEDEVVHAYVGTREGKLVGTAWFDVHEVRTKREVLMFVVDGERKIRRIELLAFAEPEEYAPRASWYAQFHGRALDDELRLGRAIKGITGATITARVTTRAARKILALHAVAFPREKTR